MEKVLNVLDTIGGATLVFDTELIAVNGKTSGGANPETESEL